MVAMGYCPSGRLFEAAACETPLVSDWWEGLDAFFEPGKEILVGQSTEDAVRALQLPPEELRKMVVTPEGTTAAGLAAMEKLKTADGLIAAIEAAVKRSEEMARENS